LKLKQILLVAVLLVAVIAAGEYYASMFGNSSSATKVISIEIIGGVGAGTVDRPYPSDITVKLGQNVTLAILNTDDNTHGWVAPALGIDTGKILPGHTYRLTLIANQTGTFEFTQPPGYCTAGFGGVCNSVQNMTLTMNVSP